MSAYPVPPQDGRRQPREVEVHEAPHTIERYRPATRINHWLVAISFVLTAISGMALFHPALFPLSALVGGGTWARILHPFLGLLMIAGFVFLALRMWRDNLLDAGDRVWLRNMRKVMDNEEEDLPPVGRYNAGQKLLFWVLVVSLLALLLTGFVIWRAYFSHLFPIGLLRFSSLLHAVFGLVMVVSIIVHVYAAFWVKGAFGAMTEGRVSHGWAWRHHRLWFRDVLAGRRKPD